MALVVKAIVLFSVTKITTCVTTETMELRWRDILEAQMQGHPFDPAHDLLHSERVALTARTLAAQEGAQLAIVVPAAWLHDCVNIPKDDPRRKEASKLSAERACTLLREHGYPERYLAGIAHAIEAHSYSRGLKPSTIEAQVVQDADRLDGLGAIGVARCFATAGVLRRPFYSLNDPLCETRKPNDALYTLDHFFAKLFKTVETLQTQAGRAEGARRAQRMRAFLDGLHAEITS